MPLSTKRQEVVPSLRNLTHSLSWSASPAAWNDVVVLLADASKTQVETSRRFRQLLFQERVQQRKQRQPKFTPLSVIWRASGDAYALESDARQTLRETLRLLLRLGRQGALCAESLQEGRSDFGRISVLYCSDFSGLSNKQSLFRASQKGVQGKIKREP